MPKVFAFLGQAVLYALVALCLGSFATSPVHRPFPEGQAQVEATPVVKDYFFRVAERPSFAETAP